MHKTDTAALQIAESETDLDLKAFSSQLNRREYTPEVFSQGRRLDTPLSRGTARKKALSSR